MDIEIKSIDNPVDQPSKPSESTGGKKKSGRLKKRILIHFIAIPLVCALAAGGMYLWRDNVASNLAKEKDGDISKLQSDVKILEKKLKTAQSTNTETTNGTQVACSEVQPSASAVESIKASVTSGNTAALASYSTTSVNVILAATEGIGPSTPTAMTMSVSDFISDATAPWDFALSAATLSTYSAGGYTQYFPSTAVVGKSANGKVISFSFDCNGKIDTVFMAVSGELL